MQEYAAVEIPGGKFAMGDALGEGGPDERPVHEVFVSTFLMDATPVTALSWREVYNWACLNGYEFSNRGLGKGPDHPVHSIN